MLLLAAECIEKGRYQNPYTLILADEFQDSSRARIRLLKALASQNAESTYLCVVGDDWQGINRFAGADISVMPEFEKIFPFATRLSLGTTFRCPQKLCDISSTFIRANPVQIKKQVSSANGYKTKKYVLAYGSKTIHARNNISLSSFTRLKVTSRPRGLSLVWMAGSQCCCWGATRATVPQRCDSGRANSVTA